MELTVKKGSAIKWIEAISRTEWVFDDTTLRYAHGGFTYGSPLGVLCDFLDPDGWYLPPEWPIRYEWHGQSAFPDPARFKSCNMKVSVGTNVWVPLVPPLDVAEVFAPSAGFSAKSWADAAHIINTCYEAF